MRPGTAAATCFLALLAGVPLSAEDRVSPRVTCRFAQSEHTESAGLHLEGLCDLLRRQETIASMSPDVQITLVADAIGAAFLRAHLTWATPERSGRGPSVDFGFLDAELSPLQYQFVVVSLLNATNLPTNVTNGD